MGRSLVDSALLGVIYAFCDAGAAPHGCMETVASKSIKILTARTIKIAWRHGKSESVPSLMKACRRRTSPLSSCARITSAPMSYRSCADGRAVFGRAWRQAPRSRQRWLAGACVDGYGVHLSLPLCGGSNEVESDGWL